jgi:hypothetical protein
VQAKAAALAGKGVDLELMDGAEAAGIEAKAAASTGLLVDNGHLLTPELVCLSHCRLKDEVKVGSIDIAVADNLIVGQRR